MSNLNIGPMDLVLFLDILLRWKPFAVVDREPLGKMIAEADPDRIFCYVQKHGEVDIQDQAVGPDCCIVWRIADWRTSNEKWLLGKAIQEKDRQDNALFKNRVLVLAEVIMVRTGLDQATSIAIATPIVKDKNIEAAKVMGYTGEL